jgi:hypothetical protein
MSDLQKSENSRQMAITQRLGPTDTPIPVDDEDGLRQDLADTSNPAKGDAMIGVRQPFTNAVALTQHEKNAEVISVKDFGAVGNGIVDDTTAFQNAADAAAFGGSIYIPVGTYNISSAITWNAKALTWYGDGPASSVIVGIADTLIFNAGSTSRIGITEIRGIGFKTTIANTAGCIKLFFDGSAGAALGYPRPSCVLDNLIFQGVNIFSSHWATCIYTIDALVPIFKNIHIVGHPTNVSSDLRCIGIYCTTSVGGVAIYKFNEVYTLFCDKGILIDSNASPGIEGVYVESCDFVGNNYGVAHQNGNTTGYKPPQFVVSNCHAECHISAVFSFNITSVLISNCLFYAANGYDLSPAIVDIRGADGGKVHDCIIYARPTNLSANAIRIVDSSNIEIHNIQTSTRATGVNFTGSLLGSGHRARDVQQIGSGAAVSDTTPSANTINQVNSNSTSTWVSTPVGHQMLYGAYTATTDVTGAIRVTYPKRFNTFFSVIANPNFFADPGAAHIPTGFYTYEADITGFTIRFENSASTSRTVAYIAIGL